MPTEAALPTAFRALTNVVRYVQQESASTYTSTCPHCQDIGHSGNGWPDRFIMFDDDHPTGFCRRCGLLWYPDQAAGYDPPSAPELEARRQQMVAREEARKRSAERALEHLRQENWARRWHEALDDRARGYWARRGVPRVMQDFWQLGWAHEHEFYWQGAPHYCDAATIPLFTPDERLLNVKMRLEPAPLDASKYRYAIAGQGEPLFRCNLDTPTEGAHVVAVEGEIKAMVTYAALDDAKTCMVGLPGTNPSPEIVAELGKAERVTLVMDPGAKAQAIALARKIGLAKTRLLLPPHKIDDGILAARFDSRQVQRLLQSAVKLDAFVS